MKKILVLCIALSAIAHAQTIRVKDCTVPKVRDNKLIYHAVDGRIIYGGDHSPKYSPNKEAYNDGWVKIPSQRSYTINQDGLDCVINVPNTGGSPVPASRPFGIK